MPAWLKSLLAAILPDVLKWLGTIFSTLDAAKQDYIATSVAAQAQVIAQAHRVALANRQKT